MRHLNEVPHLCGELQRSALLLAGSLTVIVVLAVCGLGAQLIIILLLLMFLVVVLLPARGSVLVLHIIFERKCDEMHINCCAEEGGEEIRRDAE